jgi:hypothetical protein
MARSQTIALFGLLLIIFVLTGFAAAKAPKSLSPGILAPVLLPALLTWYLIFMFAHGKDIVEMLTSFFLGRPKQERRQSLLATLAAVGLMLVFSLAFIRIGLPQWFAKALEQSASFFVFLGFKPPQLPQTSPANPSSAEVALHYYTIFVFAAVVISSFILFFAGFRGAFRSAREFAGPVTEEDLRKEALGVVQEAAASLRSDDRFHDTILRCYRRMCAMLSDKGFVIGSAQTAREFAQNVSGKLGLGADAVKGLTFLFEEARYSDHEINDKKRATALNELDSLQRALAGSAG